MFELSRSICREIQTPFKMRHSNHKREIKKNIGGLGEHFFNSECNFENHYSVTLIDRVKPGDKVALKKREDHWMYQLRTFRVLNCYIKIFWWQWNEYQEGRNLKTRMYGSQFAASGRR